MRSPMPSPRGTNHARLFITTNPHGAYDERLSEESGAELYAFLQGKLSDEDLAEFCKLAGIDAGLGMDNPEPFKGMPQPGGGKFGQDSSNAVINRARANAARITVNR